MIRFCSLFSGSTGNSYFVEVDDTKILVDAGVSAIKIKDSLELIGEDITNMDAIVITHEHQDHIKSLKTIMTRYKVSAYISKDTFYSLDSILKPKDYEDEKIKSKVTHFETGKQFKVHDVDIQSVKTLHDAADPCIFVFEDKSGNKLSIVTDLGQVTSDIKNAVIGSNLVVLESNYEKTLLDIAPYPFHIQKRIAGSYGHLSNDQCFDFAKTLYETGTEHIVYGHISTNSNEYSIVSQNGLNVLDTLNDTLKDKVNFEVATKEDNSKVYIFE